MSYRRNTRSSVPPSPQVTYHQNSARPGIIGQGFQQVKPSFPQQQQQPQAPSPQQPVQQQQFQQQFQQQQPKQPQQTSPVQQPAQQTQNPAYNNPTLQTPPKPQGPGLTLKAEPGAIAKEDKAVANPVGEEEMESEAGETRKWQKRPKPLGYKVNKVQKRRRKNARFRKLLTPKNAIMVLNELQPGVAFDSREVTNAFNQTNYIVSFEVDGQQFSGEGTSKGAAKQAAAEAAVKSLILKKIAESKRKDDEPMETAENNESEQGDGSEVNSTNGGGRRRELPEDEVPWGSLASFALYRLFNDWESQGTYVPFPAGAVVKPKAPGSTQGPTATPTAVAAPKPAKPAKPATQSNTHPVTLVGRLRPGSIFSEISRNGQPPNMTFVMGVTIDGKNFTGVAKNKKDAKKECAKAALTALGVAWEEQPTQTA